MKRRQKITWYIFGLLSAMLVGNLLTPALAALSAKTVEVYTGITLYINDIKLEPKDANGTPVDVFAYNGTTYVPIRAVSEALGMAAQYDSANQAGYIGLHSTGLPAAQLLTEMDYIYGSDYINTVDSEQDNQGAPHTNCIYLNFDRTYRLNGQYTKITGTLFQTYLDRHSSIETQRMGINIYGDGKLLYTYSPEVGTIGWIPVDFSVDLTGVLELKVEFYGNGRPNIYLGEATMWTV